MILYIITAITFTFCGINSIVFYIKEKRNLHNKKYYYDFLKELAVDIFVISFSLSEIFPDITWL